jgi:hypothetical protein
MQNTFLPYFTGATPAQLYYGRTWYERAERTVYLWADLFGYRPDQVAGIIAALSQRASWKQNLQQAHRCLRGERPRGLSTAVEKAVRIRDGANACPSTILRGPKILAFYHALLGVKSAIVLDVWMLRAAGHGKVNQNVYRDTAQQLLRESREAGVPPAEFQAVVWCVIRGRHK